MRGGLGIVSIRCPICRRLVACHGSNGQPRLPWAWDRPYLDRLTWHIDGSVSLHCGACGHGWKPRIEN